MEFLEQLWTRTLTTIDNHPRLIAGGAFIFSLLFHPVLTAVIVVSFIFYAYFAKEAKK